MVNCTRSSKAARSAKNMSLQCFILAALCITDTVENVPVVNTNTSGNASTANERSPEKLLSRRRGLIPSFRRRGDVYSQLLQKSQAKKIWSEFLKKHKTSIPNPSFKANESNSKVTIHRGNQIVNAKPENRLGEENGGLIVSSTVVVGSRHRRRRWDYDENYDWENGRKDYVIPGEEPKKETKFEKFAKSWQKYTLKVIFLFSFVSMICCCCLAVCKKFCSKVCETVCWHLKDYRDICLNRDPTWRKARKFADDYGIELDYDQYKKIKKNYEEGFERQGHDEYKNLSGR